MKPINIGKMVYKPIFIPEGGMLKTTNSTTSQLTWKIQGEYKNTFGDIHDIQIMAGSEIRKKLGRQPSLNRIRI